MLLYGVKVGRRNLWGWEKSGSKTCYRVEIERCDGRIIKNHVENIGVFADNKCSVASVWAFEDFYLVVRGKMEEALRKLGWTIQGLRGKWNKGRG